MKRIITFGGIMWNGVSFLTKKQREAMKDSYGFKCASCGHEQNAKISMAMMSGINSGHGSCLKCKSFLHLRIAGKVMKSKLWEDHIKTIDRGENVR